MTQRAGSRRWIATEGALWGSVMSHGLLKGAVIVSDDAGQFNVGHHALCWVHAERLIHKLVGFNESQRRAIERTRARVWRFYAALKTYCRDPTPRRKAALDERFERLFSTATGFATLDRLLARLHANKDALLVALERPDIPLHTNRSENDIRCQVTKRKISGGTRSDAGRDARDAFLGLMKTCDVGLRGRHVELEAVALQRLKRIGDARIDRVFIEPFGGEPLAVEGHGLVDTLRTAEQLGEGLLERRTDAPFQAIGGRRRLAEAFQGMAD